MKWTPLHRGLAVFGFFFFSFAVVINATPNNWINLYRLSEQGVPVRATVKAIHPENHRACDFSYEVGGRVYSHSESCHLEIGEESVLNYLPPRPSVAIGGSANDKLKAAVLVPLGMSLAFAIFAALGTWLMGRRRARHT